MPSWFRRSRVALLAFRLTLVTALLTALLGGLSVPVARAATITVTITSDTVNPTDGKCSLREAINAANSDTPSGIVNGECPAGSGPDTIVLADNTYGLNLGWGGACDCGQVLLPSITSTITIEGNGATIERTALALRLLYVADAGNLTLKNLTLKNGMPMAARAAAATLAALVWAAPFSTTAR